MGPLFRILGFFLLVVTIVGGWYYNFDFHFMEPKSWMWLLGYFKKPFSTLPQEISHPIYYGFGVFTATMLVSAWADRQAHSTTIGSDRKTKDLHGSAKWATARDVKRSGLLSAVGVVVGGWKGVGQIKTLRHDGPEHVFCFAPTRSGKGVGLVIPTLLSWPESALVLDIKGENYALSAGWRASQGQRVFRFDPASAIGSAKYNPLEEVRIGSDHEIADCQNIAIMIIDPDGVGLKDFWQEEGYAWLSTAILHVLYRIKIQEERCATLADVRQFMSIGDDESVGQSVRELAEKPSAKEDDDSFDRLLRDMETFDHAGRKIVNDEVRIGAARMRKRSSNERSGVHSTGTSQLTLYSDPIVSNNISRSDFKIADLMNADDPTTLYIVIPPSDIARLRPLVRILLNQFLTRLTSHMAFEGGRSVKHYKHRLLLMLDEFTSVGKLEIFEKSIAFMGGYGLKAFVIVQDLTQLQKTYGREQSIVSNCHVRIAYAPNTLETARLLSDMAGKTTVMQKRTSASWRVDQLSTSHSESLSEISRPLLTPDECMALPGLQKKANGSIARAGDMLIFQAGHSPIYGRQLLYFQDNDLLARARIDPPNSQTAA